MTDLIYRTYPGLAEGEMARLRASVVNTLALADLARSLGLGEHIRLGRGEEATGGRDKDSLLANTLEAVVGAVYLDRGHDAVAACLDPIFTERLEQVVATGDRYDAKTALQEIVVRGSGGQPEYLVASSGPDHDKRFSADVMIAGRLMGSGVGRSKKEAEYNAARQALARMGEEIALDLVEGGEDARTR